MFPTKKGVVSNEAEGSYHIDTWYYSPHRMVIPYVDLLGLIMCSNLNGCRLLPQHYVWLDKNKTHTVTYLT